jgi:hypothetical protein
LIIWGSKGKQEVISQGQFYCPKCNNNSRFLRKHVARYFTLYFIPLFKTKDLGEFIECQTCKSGFDPKVLEPGSQKILKVVASVRYSLLHGISPAEVRMKLMGEGATSETAEMIIKRAQT